MRMFPQECPDDYRHLVAVSDRMRGQRKFGIGLAGLVRAARMAFGHGNAPNTLRCCVRGLLTTSDRL